MKNQQVMENNKKSAVLTMLGGAIMIALTATKIVPSSNIAGFSVFVGIAFFFIVEAVAKTPNAQSGLRFDTILKDFKKPGVFIWALLPCFSGILTLVVGNLIFGTEFSNHVQSRASSILSFDKTMLLIMQFIIAGFGEEIAFRGFFLGKTSKIFPTWLCIIVSSVIFAAGHIASGKIGVVIFDIFNVFIDSVIFSLIYQKSGNCVISTFSHIFGNIISFLIFFNFFN